MTTIKPDKVVIIGAGMAGLSVAFHLEKMQQQQQTRTEFRLFEAGKHYGGLARSFQWHGVDCDFAPHRLFTQDEQLLDEMLALVDCHKVPRQSRIRIVNRWIADPVNVLELLTNIPPLQASKIVMSFVSTRLWVQLRKSNSGDSFSSFVKAHYGRGLDELFFKPYAEKLFGIPATAISRVWGEKKVRVAGFRDMIRRNNKLYFDHFYYPKKGGYGAIVDALAQPIKPKIATSRELLELSFDRQRQQYTSLFKLADGELESVDSDTIVSTIPMPTLLRALGHQLELTYRPAKLVYLSIAREQVMPDQWVYLVDTKHRINRISEFKNFNPQQVDSVNQTAVTANTVICAEVTNLDSFNVSAVIDELVALGLIESHQILDSKVIDIHNAYPIYDLNYQQHLVRAENILAGFPRLYQVGRQAQFMHQDVDEIYATAKRLAVQLLKT